MEGEKKNKKRKKKRFEQSKIKEDRESGDRKKLIKVNKSK